jgi:hypothetical protein
MRALIKYPGKPLQAMDETETNYPLGTYIRLRSGKWIKHVKRRTSGSKYKNVGMLPPEIHVELMILGEKSEPKLTRK